MSDRPARKSPRLQDFDYAQDGTYFVTICTLNRTHVFGEVVEGEMRLNACGEIAQACCDDLSHHYLNIELDAFVVMPNHIHGIIFITGAVVVSGVGEGLRPSPTDNTPRRHGLPEIIRAFKSFSARRINELRDSRGAHVWQRSFHDHIIRNENELNTLRQYILCNPAKWEEDRYFGMSP